MSAAPAIRPTFAPRRVLRFRCTLRGVSSFGRVRERRTRSGAVHWFIDARPFGRIYQVRDALGEQPFATRAEAERLLERVRARIDDGMAPEVAVGKLLPRGVLTIGQRSEVWLADQRRKATSGEITRASLEAMERQVARYWGPWQDAFAGGVTTGNLADWQSWLLEAGLAPVTVRGVMSYFATFMRWLYDREEIERVPRLPKLRVPEHEPQIMSPDAQDRVLVHIVPEHVGIYLAAVDLALRPNEARALSFADFELVDGVPWVIVRRAFKGQRRTDDVRGTKTGRVRRIPCSDRLWAWVQAHGARSAGGSVFLLRGRPLSGWQLNRLWKAACTRAGVPVASVRESTRHSTATAWREHHGLERTREGLGHTDSATTERYGRFRPTQLIPMVRGARASLGSDASKQDSKS